LASVPLLHHPDIQTVTVIAVAVDDLLPATVVDHPIRLLDLDLAVVIVVVAPVATVSAASSESSRQPALHSQLVPWKLSVLAKKPAHGPATKENAFSLLLLLPPAPMVLSIKIPESTELAMLSSLPLQVLLPPTSSMVDDRSLAVVVVMAVVVHQVVLLRTSPRRALWPLLAKRSLIGCHALAPGLAVAGLTTATTTVGVPENAARVSQTTSRGAWLP
jgi:hypothetical protein